MSLFAADPSESDLDDAARTDTLTQLIALIFGNPPATLTAAQATALRAILDLADAAIKSRYEGNSDTNALTDALLTKLNGITAGAQPDQSATNIRNLLNLSTAETNQLFTGVSIAGQVITFTRNNLGDAEITIPSGGGGGGAADGVVDELSFGLSGSELTLTAGRTVGADVVSDPITLPSGGGGGGTPQALSRFEAVTTANTTAQALSTTYADVIEIDDADVFANVGTFHVCHRVEHNDHHDP